MSLTSWGATLLTLLCSVSGTASTLSTLGAPLRDPSVLRTPEGDYLLTGTTAWNGDQPDQEPDFHNNRGVRVWSSTDLTTWTDLGYVWDLWTDPDNGHGDWQAELYPVPGLEPGIRARGFLAPKIAHDGQRYWITYSMNGYGAAAMPGQSSLSGGFTDVQMLAEAGGAETDRSDASLFVDDDGTRYLVWGGGMIAPLKDVASLEGLGNNEVGFSSTPVYLPSSISGFFTDATLPQHGLPYGVSVIREPSGYAFIYSATTLRNGSPSEDAYITRSPNLFGPYSRPEQLATGSGRVTVFTGPGDAPWIAYTPPSDPNAYPVLEPLPASTPAVADAAPAAPARGTIVTYVPCRPPSEKPSSIPQLLDMIEPVMDHPLRDAALCQGPDGTWYLTGTEASRAANGTLDWANNRGVRIWSSTDRQEWTDLGYVWEFDVDGQPWQTAASLDLTIGAKARVGRAITAPEIHFLKGSFWITYSINGSGSGLLKSTSGDIEGPYQDQGLITRIGRDPSLFEDADGTVYWVLGPGLIAAMNASMDGLVETPRPLFTDVNWYPRYLRRLENMGIWGSYLTKSGSDYLWIFTTRSGRSGRNTIDTMASWAPSLNGPWGEPCLMLANGGQSTLVPDGGSGWLATVSGEDEYANCPFKAAITPVVSNGNLGQALRLNDFNANSLSTFWYAVNSYKATALDLWKGHPDFIPFTLRDVAILRDIDGMFYCTGSFWAEDSLRRDVVFFRSSDLINWEQRPPVYSYFQLDDDGMISPEEQAQFDELILKDAQGDDWRYRIQIGEQKIWRFDADYYMAAQMFSFPNRVLLLKSSTGTIDGPFGPLQWIVAGADFMQDTDGTIISNGSGLRNRYLSGTTQLENTATSGYFSLPATDLQQEEPWLTNVCFSEDSEAGIEIISGKYVVWSTDWTGSYDVNYRYADQRDGTYRGSMRILPYGGNGKFFQDLDGTWFYAYFNNSNEYASRTQNSVRMNMYPLFVGFDDTGELIIEPRAVRQSRAELERMGAIWQSSAFPEAAPMTWDEWVEQNLAGLPPEQKTPQATPASDGIPNLIKYAFGIDDPFKTSGTVGSATFDAETDTEQIQPRLNFQLPINRVNARLDVQFSSDMQTWVSQKDLTDSIEIQEIDLENASSKSISVLLKAAPTESSSRFARIQVSLIP